MVRIAAIEVWLNSSWVTREEADGQQEVVHRADDRADRELPLEAEPQIGQHREDRDDDAERAALHEFAGNARTDRLDAAEFVGVGEGVAQLGDRRLLARFAARLHVEAQHDVGLGAGALHFDRAEPEAFALGAQSRRDRPTPLLARNSTCVPPAKSMPKFMPTMKNIITATIDRNADRG